MRLEIRGLGGVQGVCGRVGIYGVVVEAVVGGVVKVCVFWGGVSPVRCCLGPVLGA